MGFSKISLKHWVDDFNKRDDHPHGKLLTLSRYEIGFDKDYFDRICKYGGWNIEIDDSNPRSLLLNDEIVFKTLGFESLDSMDYSEYEGATIIHDLNDTNIPQDLIGKYDYILDCGTIEHVFNFRNVMENIFKMLKTGGTFIFDQPTFFDFNHGYYNFSPCLYYEYFEANNYEINTFIPYACKDNFVYIADTVVNDICGHMPLIENSYNLVWGSVTKTPKTTFDRIPYQGQYVKTWETNPNTVIYDTFKLADDNSIYLYGTGQFARSVLSMLPVRYRNKIAGFLSKEVDEIGQMFYGYKIYAFDDIMDNCSTILITTSKQYQDIIYNRIKQIETRGIKIVRLYR